MAKTKRRAFNEIGRYQGVQKHTIGSEVLELNMSFQLMHYVTVKPGEDAHLDANIQEIEDTFVIVVSLGFGSSLSFSDKFKFSDGTPPLLTSAGIDVLGGVIFDDMILCSAGYNYF